MMPDSGVGSHIDLCAWYIAEYVGLKVVAGGLWVVSVCGGVVDIARRDYAHRIRQGGRE